MIKRLSNPTAAPFTDHDASGLQNFAEGDVVIVAVHVEGGSAADPQYTIVAGQEAADPDLGCDPPGHILDGEIAIDERLQGWERPCTRFLAWGEDRMKRQVLYLSVRADTDETLEQVATRVGHALGCTFAEGEHERWYAQVAYVFGLKLSLMGRTGIGGKNVAKLVSNVAEHGLIYAQDGSGRVERDRVDISSYIVDLLTTRTGLRWYQPTAEDRVAEGRAAARFDDWLGGVGAEGWTSNDEERFGDW
ncbi:hypothetical protein ACQP1W_22025 [Spirillospora sp. CA-255316]